VRGQGDDEEDDLEERENGVEEGELEESVMSADAAVGSVGNGDWINFTLMPQLTEFKGGGRSLVDDDGLQARLIFSYEF